MRKILIAEDIPSHNKGEEALMLGLIKSLKNMEPVEFSMLSLNPEHDASNYKGLIKIIDARGITPAHVLDSQASVLRKTSNILNFWLRYALFAILFILLREKATKIMTNPTWKAYCDADLILMGHDSFFTPRYHSAIALFCAALKKPVAMYAGTAENKLFHTKANEKKLAKAIMRYAISKVPLILLRETISYDNLVNGLGLDPKRQKIEVHPDLAFIVDPSSPERASEIMQIEGVPTDKPLVGMTVSMRHMQHCHYELPLEERTQKSIEALTAAIDYMVEKFDANIVFIPHSIGPSRYLDDRATADLLIERAKHPERIFNIRTEYSVRDLKALAGKLDIAFGARLHFIIDAVCNHVPSIIMTRQVEARSHGIIGDMVGLKDWVYSVHAIDAKSLTALLQKLWEQKSEVRAYLENKMPEIKADVYTHGQRTEELLKSYHA